MEEPALRPRRLLGTVTDPPGLLALVADPTCLVAPAVSPVAPPPWERFAPLRIAYVSLPDRDMGRGE
jgi:hypothetical protein